MENVFLIVGLGNPGAEYANTRHNAGFSLVERLAADWKCGWANEKRFRARMARITREGKRILLCEPQTFMNLSGETVGALGAFYRLPLERILVAADDADLPVGTVRLRPGGSSGGHHGLESIEQHLASREFRPVEDWNWTQRQFARDYESRPRPIGFGRERIDGESFGTRGQTG